MAARRHRRSASGARGQMPACLPSLSAHLPLPSHTPTTAAVAVLAGSSGPVGSPCALAPCKRCGDDGKCAECMPSYGLAYRGYCQPCADPDCADCGEDPSFCTKCNADLVSYEPGGAWPNPGYTTANGTCMWVSEPALSRQPHAPPLLPATSAAWCHSTAHPLHDALLPTSVQCRAYCNACSDGTGACTRCETLFGMVDGKCQLCLLPDGSENTVDADSLDALYDFEIAKPDACRRCDGDVSRCTACLDGYTLTAGGKCTKVSAPLAAAAPCRQSTARANCQCLSPCHSAVRSVQLRRVHEGTGQPLPRLQVGYGPGQRGQLVREWGRRYLVNAPFAAAPSPAAPLLISGQACRPSHHSLPAFCDGSYVQRRLRRPWLHGLL